MRQIANSPFLVNDLAKKIAGFMNPDGTEYTLPPVDIYTPDLTEEQKAGLVDSTNELMDAASKINEAGRGTFIVNGTLICTKSIKLPVESNIIFTPGSKILPRANLQTGANDFTANTLILVNCSSGSAWDVPFPNIRGYADGINVDNSANPSLNVGALKVGCGMLIRNIRTTHCWFNVRTAGTYLDLVRIDGSMCSEQQGTDFAIELSNLGDGIQIKSSHAYIAGGASVPKNVKLNACQGAVIESTIGGDMYFNQCRAIKFQGGHHETGVITVDGSDVTIDDLLTWVGTSMSIRCTSNAGGERRSLVLRNWDNLFRSNNTSITPTQFDLQVGTGCNVVVENCSRVFGTTANAYQSEKFGIFVANSSGTALTAWNNYSYAYSRRGEIDGRQLVSSAAFVNPGSGTAALFNSTTTTNSCAFQAASNTYYYQAQLIYDATRRLGEPSTSSEVSFAVTNGGNCPRFVIGPGMASRTQNCFLRLYRGTATNSYDFYVDVPLISMREITDRGDVCSGFAWIARTAATTATIFSTLDLAVKGSLVDCTIATIPPTIGTWTEGDKCYNSAPAASGFIGCVVDVSGTPGTHKTWGAISA